MASAQHSVYASCGECVNMKFSFYISIRHVGQDAASKAAAVINTGRCRQAIGQILRRQFGDIF